MDASPVILFNDWEHGGLIGKACRVIPNPRCDIVISRMSPEGKLLGGVIYQSFTGTSIQVHVAGFSPNWLSKDLLWVVFDYPFSQLKVGTVFSQIRESNKVALEFNLKIGFKEVCRIDGVFPEGQCVITSITRDTCRWLNIKPKSLERGARSSQ